MDYEKTDKIIEKLLEKYPDPQLELDYSNAFELLIATILAAQCTDQRVNAVTKTFFKEYPTPQSIVSEKLDVIAEKIKQTGFYRNKAKSLVACCEQLIKRYDGKVPDSLAELVKLPGVGRKTANIVLGNAFGKQTIAVDTHVKRVANRLGLTQASNPDVIEQDLMKIVDPNKWTLFTRLIVLHGRYVCQSRKPKCKMCVLLELCPWEEKQL